MSPSHTAGGKVPAEFDMTDGCGLANRRLLEIVGDILLGGRCPTAIQMRFGGFKVKPFFYPTCVVSSSYTGGALASSELY